MQQGEWSVMAHGLVNVVNDEQTGPRATTKSFAQSMAMLMANRRAGPGTLGLRAMVSLDPTMGKSGYPLVFQTGETADGATPLVDRQHRTTFFMELATTYSMTLGDDGAAFAYFGLPGEPALGPQPFMHRFSGMRNPRRRSPTTGSTRRTSRSASRRSASSKGPMQLEASWFNGREPDQSAGTSRRASSTRGRRGCRSTRCPSLSMQVSYGDLTSPEQLEPDTRVPADDGVNQPLHGDRGTATWATTLAYGLNRKSAPGPRRLREPAGCSSRPM
jgi:hypothetical protein